MELSLPAFPAAFRQSLADARTCLETVTESEASVPYRPGGWTRKEILGHLLDSAAHNHVRFLTAATQGEVTVISYEQRKCIALHAYAELPWADLLRHWVMRNEMIARAMDHIPSSAYAYPCHLAGGGKMTLEELMQDYLVHLHHHVARVRAGS